MKKKVKVVQPKFKVGDQVKVVKVNVEGDELVLGRTGKVLNITKKGRWGVLCQFPRFKAGHHGDGPYNVGIRDKWWVSPGALEKVR